MVKTLEKKAPKSRAPRANGALKATPTATYADGRPQDQVQFFDAKLILKPDFFSSVRGFTIFSDLVAEAAAKVAKVKYEAFDLANVRPRIREVMFVDTEDFRMYNNSFILRRRTMYQDGFPISDPELVVKYRSADLEKAAAADVRPKIAGPYRIKLKAEALPLKDQVGGYRMLYAHNCIFPTSSVHEGDRANLQTIARIMPALAGLIGSAEGRVDLVNSTLVEEVLMDIGRIDFGKGFMAKANISLWRSLGDHKVMCGEFAYQTRFQNKEDIEQKIRQRVEELFIKLQLVAAGWLYLGTTKTGLVYRAKGNAPQSHE
ncbi:MAG: hypothetical protein JOZ91_11275 [Candidatus Eremiobacteraeota bacterium]|nr:hypothetical protein [Candidatus Eremiobacteraeota bacterium]